MELHDKGEIRLNDPLPGSSIGLAAKIAIAVVAVFEILLGLVFMRGHAGSTVSLYIAIAIFVLILMYHSLAFFGSEPEGDRAFRWIDFTRHCAISLVGGLLLELGTLIGAHAATPVVLSDWNPKRIVLFAAVVYAIRMWWLIEGGRGDGSSLKKRAVHAATALRGGMRPVLPVAAGLLAIDVVVSLIVSRFTSIALAPLVAFFAALSITVATLVSFARRGGVSKELLFLAIALPVGLAMIIAFPASNLFSWDDEVHYSRSLEISYLFDSETTASDRMMMTLFAQEPGFTMNASFDRFPVSVDTQWSTADMSRLYSELNANNSVDSVVKNEGFSAKISFASVGHVPGAVGLWLGRLLHLPFVATYALGRVANLLAYCALCFLAIRIIPVKKLLLTVFLLFPTSLLMASNYAYDPWVIAMTCLGLAVFVRAYLARGELDVRGVLASIVLLVFAFGPKAVYFPLIGVLLLPLIGSKRLTARDKRRIGLAACAAGLFLLVSFVLPLVMSGAGSASDARGGSDVDSAAQISYVLHNPFAYAYTLARFLATVYLPLPNLEHALNDMAYLGSLSSAIPLSAPLLSVFLICSSLIDSDKESARLVRIGTIIGTLILTISALVLVCSALYVSFTGVGATSISGVQPRYMLPLAPFFFLFIFNFRIEVSAIRAQERISVAMFGMSAAIAYLSVFVLLISRIVV